MASDLALITMGRMPISRATIRVLVALVLITLLYSVQTSYRFAWPGTGAGAGRPEVEVYGDQLPGDGGEQVPHLLPPAYYSDKGMGSRRCSGQVGMCVLLGFVC